MNHKDTANSLRKLLTKSASKRNEMLNEAIRHFEHLNDRDAKDDALQGIGESAAQSLASMVAALNVDYDRLEELREERKDFGDGTADGPGTLEWIAANPDDADELASLEADAGDCTSREDAEQRIQEDPLSLQVKSGWYSPGETPEASEFELLLGTGGPATRIIGELDEHNQPYRARLQAQDWFTVWTDYRGDAISSDDLLAYCNVFYFGE